MKKFFLIFITLIIVVIAGVYGLLFTTVGNKYLASFIQTKIDQKLAGLQIKNFYLRPTELQINLDYLNMLELQLGGSMKPASRTLNLLYTITSKNLELIGIKEQIDIKGKIAGFYKDISIEGDGNLLDSELKAYARLQDFEPTKMHLNINKLQVGKLAKIANMPIVDGVLGLNIEAQTLQELQAKIDGNISFLSEANRMSGLNLSSLGKFDIDARLQRGKQAMQGEMKMHSNKLKISLLDLAGDGDKISTKLIANAENIKWINPTLNSDLNLAAQINKNFNKLDANANINGENININKLAAQYDLASKNGEIKANVQANAALLGMKKAPLADLKLLTKLRQNALSSLNAQGIALSGSLTANLADNRLSASLKHANLYQVLVLADAPLFANGNLDADANITDLAKLKGNVQVNIDGQTREEYFAQELALNIATPLSASFAANLLGPDNITFKGAMQSGLIDTFNFDAKLQNGGIVADYDATTQLENFNALLAKKMKGKVALNGDVKAGKFLLATLKSSDLFGAQLDAKLQNSDLNATIRNIDIPRFAEAFDFPDVYAAKANADLQYSLKSQSGELTAQMSEGHLQPHPAINVINLVTKSNIERIVFNKGTFKSIISPETASIDAELSAQNAHLKAHDGTYGLQNKELQLPVELTFNNNEIKGKLKNNKKGEVRFVPDAQNLVQNIMGIANKLGKNGDEQGESEAASSPNVGADLSTKEGRKDAAKNLLKGLLNR